MISASVALVEERYEAKPSGLSAQNQIAPPATTVATVTIVKVMLRFITIRVRLAYKYMYGELSG